MAVFVETSATLQSSFASFTSFSKLNMSIIVDMQYLTVTTQVTPSTSGGVGWKGEKTSSLGSMR